MKPTKPKIDHRTVKAALAWLKAKELERVNGGQSSYRGYATGEILRALKLGDGYDSRERAYQVLIRGLKHACELGFLEHTDNGTCKRFKYTGPEIETAKHAADSLKAERASAVVSLAKRKRIAIDMSYDKTTVTVPIRDFLKLA